MKLKVFILSLALGALSMVQVSCSDNSDGPVKDSDPVLDADPGAGTEVPKP